MTPAPRRAVLKHSCAAALFLLASTAHSAGADTVPASGSATAVPAGDTLDMAATSVRDGKLDEARALLAKIIAAEPPGSDRRRRAEEMLAAVESLTAHQIWQVSASIIQRYQTNPAAIAESLAATPNGARRPDWSTQVLTSLGQQYFFGRPGQSDSWQTNLAASVRRQHTLPQLDLTQIEATSGPAFRLPELGFGLASVRPYAAASYDEFGHHPFLKDVGGGLAFSVLIGNEANLDFSAERRALRYVNSAVYPTLSERDATDTLGQIALRLSLSRPLKLGIGASYITDAARARFWSRTEIGLSAALTYFYDPGLWQVGQPGSVSIGLGMRHAHYEAADPSVDAGTTRIDDEWRAGLTNSLPLSRDLVATQKLQWTQVASTVPIYGYRDLAITLGLSWAISGPSAAPAAARGDAAPPDWAGFRVGAQVGYARGTANWSADAFFWTDAPDTNIFRPFEMGPSGPLYGGIVGYDIELGQLLLGLEADWSRSSMHKAIVSPYFPDFEKDATRISWLGSMTARVGYDFGNWIAYGKGGYALADIATLFSAGPLSISGGGSTWHSGWTLGAGLERRVTNTVSVGLEYDYFDLGRARVAAPEVGFPTFSTVDSRARLQAVIAHISLGLGSF